MTSDHVRQPARRRARAITVLFVLFAIGLLGAGAWVLADSQSKDREQLRTRFANGATVASALIDSLFRVAFQQGTELLTQRFSGAVTTAALDAYTARNQSLFSAVIDGNGTVIGASSQAPTRPGAEVLRAAGRTGVAVSDILGATGTPFVESASRFPLSTDPKSFRFMISASPVDVYVGFLSGSIEPLVRYGGDAYVLDGAGAVLGAVSLDSPKHPRPPSPGFGALVSRSASGITSSGGTERFYAAQPIANTRWHVAVTVPTQDLYAPASGVSRWLPWGILGILAIALLSIGGLIRRSLRAATRLAQANTQLEASQSRLRDRAVDLQTANTELQRSNAELEQFAYVASHDLSAPLRAVAGFSQLLGARYTGQLDDDADQFIEHMSAGVDRMQRIIDDLLAYSRVDRSGLQPEQVDLDAILDEVLHGLAAEISEREATVTSDPLGMASGEAGQLSLVLQNLIANGMKFTADGVRPTVHVSAEPDHDRVRIRVRDNGIGIEPDHADQIFKMFQRLHTPDEYPGTGIGLAIAQKIVDRHGGRILVEPAPGGGTDFTFDIPGEVGGA